MLHLFTEIKRLSFLLLLWAGMQCPAFAETAAMRDSMHHEVSVSCGDQLFEHLMWNKKQMYVGPSTSSTPVDATCNYRYTQHWGVGYQYRFNRWFGMGGEVDYSGVGWDELVDGSIEDGYRHARFYNLCIMPVFRFTYLHKEYVSLYTSIGIGVDVNGGTEEDLYGHKTLVGGCTDVRVLGVEVGHGHWYGSASIGGLSALRDQNTIFLAMSQIVKLSLGIRF